MDDESCIEPEDDPRAQWRQLPDPVQPSHEGQALESDASLWDRKPRYDPEVGIVR
ncbi:hypothetical protein QM588_03270 [Rhodococcus sp. IEGM 1354]|uniref:hypothetical protein n=1 Tax=Rhodococcus sp. IEGM 1354 TaxID=3047088 RepID=UPI0024B79B5A|nr:hypothetical protein [Rhodococcus sp. IEGM 1354]MDI9929415.1 hypothetical protein [Rhodococcus sp. IEGM 1354]